MEELSLAEELLHFGLDEEQGNFSLHVGNRGMGVAVFEELAILQIVDHSEGIHEQLEELHICTVQIDVEFFEMELILPLDCLLPFFFNNFEFDFSQEEKGLRLLEDEVQFLEIVLQRLLLDHFPQVFALELNHLQVLYLHHVLPRISLVQVVRHMFHLQDVVVGVFEVVHLKHDCQSAQKEAYFREHSLLNDVFEALFALEEIDQEFVQSLDQFAFLQLAALLQIGLEVLHGHLEHQHEVTQLDFYFFLAHVFPGDFD